MRARMNPTTDETETGLVGARYWRIGLPLLVLLAVAWISFRSLGTARFLPPPETNISALAGREDWAMAYRDPGHSGASDGEIGHDPAIRWSIDLGTRLFGAPAIVDGRVYIGTGDGRLLAIDSKSGRTLWEHRMDSAILSSPAVAGGLLFFGTADREVVALEAERGEVLWRFNTDGVILSSPAVYKGVVYIGNEEANVYALDAGSGAQRWRFNVEDRVSTGPAVNDAVVAVNSSSGRTYLIDVKTGKSRLDYLNSRTAGPPTLVEDRLYVSDTAGALRAIDWRQRHLPFEKAARWFRTQLWAWGAFASPPVQKGFLWASVDREETFVGAPVVAHGRVFVADRSGTVLAFDNESGAPLWRFHTGQVVDASPSALGKTLLIGDTGGRLHALDIESGRTLWRMDIGVAITSTPVVAGDAVYLTSESGILVAIE